MPFIKKLDPKTLFTIGNLSKILSDNLKNNFLSMSTYPLLRAFFLFVLLLLLTVIGFLIRLSINPMSLDRSVPVINYFIEKSNLISSASLKQLTLFYDMDQSSLMITAGSADILMISGNRYELYKVNLSISTRAFLSSLTFVPKTIEAEKVYLNILNKIDKAGIKVITSFGYNQNGYYDILNGTYVDYINKYKDHNAILLWELGNEYNYHPEWFNMNIDNWYLAMNNAAKKIKQIN